MQYKVISTTTAIEAAGAYAAEDIMSNSDTNDAGVVWTFSNMAREAYGTGTIIKAIISCETTNVTPRLTLFLYNAAPTCELDDNAANNGVKNADISQYVGKIDFPALEDLGGNSEATVVPGGYGGLPIPFKCGATANLFGVLVTRDVLTITGGDDIHIKFLVEQY